LVERRTVVGIA